MSGSCSSDDDEDSDAGSLDDFIAHTSEEEEEEEEEGEDGDDSEDEDYEYQEVEEDEDEAEDTYVPKEEMRAAYKKNPRKSEPPGYVDAKEHITQEGADEVWQNIRNILGTPAAERYYGAVARANGEHRVVLRVDYGEQNGDNTEKCMGSYETILVPLVEKLFKQKAYQPPPVSRRGGPPHYAFNGWVVKTCADITDWLHSPELWCICCQNTERNNLKKIQIMEHVATGICLMTGGNCAAYMVGAQDREDAEWKCHACDQHRVYAQISAIMGHGPP